MKKKPLLYHLSSLGAIAIAVGCFITAIVGYDEYIAGHFPLHLAVFGVPPIVVVAVLTHWHGEMTGWKNKWWKKIFRK